MSPRAFTVLISVLLLSACQPVLGPLLGAGLIENNNYRVSGRSISGWAMSSLNDQDCEPMRVFERAPVCREHQPPPPEPFCYRTLADATCYTQPYPTLSVNQWLPAPGQAR